MATTKTPLQQLERKFKKLGVVDYKVDPDDIGDAQTIYWPDDRVIGLMLVEAASKLHSIGYRDAELKHFIGCLGRKISYVHNGSDQALRSLIDKFKTLHKAVPELPLLKDLIIKLAHFYWDCPKAINEIPGNISKMKKSGMDSKTCTDIADYIIKSCSTMFRPYNVFDPTFPGLHCDTLCDTLADLRKAGVKESELTKIAKEFKPFGRYGSDENVKAVREALPEFKKLELGSDNLQVLAVQLAVNSNPEKIKSLANSCKAIARSEMGKADLAVTLVELGKTSSPEKIGDVTVYAKRSELKNHSSAVKSFIIKEYGKDGVPTSLQRRRPEATPLPKERALSH